MCSLTLDTGSGLWNPLIWGVALLIALLIGYAIRSFGNQSYKPKSSQTQAFLSGNPEGSKEDMHVKASNVYWGFTETMKWLYNALNKMHNGNIGDYMLWFVIVLAIAFMLILTVGVI